MALTLTPEGVVLAAVMMRRGGNRARLLTMIGGAPHDDLHFHSLSVGMAGRYLGLDRRYVQRLFRELVRAGVLERRPGAGSRPDAWRVRGDIRRWAVAWPKGRDADHVRLMLAEDRHLLEVAAMPLMPATPIGRRDVPFAATPIGRRDETLSATPSGRREGERYWRPMGVAASPSSSSGEPWTEGVARNGEKKKKSEEEERYTDAVAALTLKLTGCPVYGRGLDRVAELHGALGVDRAERVLASLPDGARWPTVIEALEQAARSPLRLANGHAPATVLWESWAEAGKHYSRQRSYPDADAARAAMAELAPPAEADPESWALEIEAK